VDTNHLRCIGVSTAEEAAEAGQHVHYTAMDVPVSTLAVGAGNLVGCIATIINLVTCKALLDRLSIAADKVVLDTVLVALYVFTIHILRIAAGTQK
jgi:hypothetical protein